MFKIINWFNENFPPKEFMLRSTGGIKYFKLGTAMQVILISLLITTGCLVALFTYKMQFLQTVNYKQNLALKDLRVRYSKFTEAVVGLREELKDDASQFSDTDLNVELQVKKVTKLLYLLELDLAAINKNADIKKDHRLTEVKNRLESIINEKANLLKENLEVTISLIDEKPINLELPKNIECEVKTTDAVVKGQTAASSYKPAKLNNGLNIQVPPFIESGDEIIIDTRNLEYVKKI